MKRDLKIVKTNNEYPFKDSLLALTLEAEIKRVAIDREEPVGDIIKKLAAFVGVHERQIYNYRTGKSAVPQDKILPLCKQFQSASLALAWLQDEAAYDEPDGFDLVRVVSDSAQQVLNTHCEYLKAFDDGQINGFELSKLKLSTATAFASFARMQGIAEADYQRRRYA